MFLSVEPSSNVWNIVNLNHNFTPGADVGTGSCLPKRTHEAKDKVIIASARIMSYRFVPVRGEGHP